MTLNSEQLNTALKFDPMSPPGIGKYDSGAKKCLLFYKDMRCDKKKITRLNRFIFIYLFI